MRRGLHPRSSVDRLYIPRAEGGRGLLSVKDCVELKRPNLFDYTANNNRLLKAATEELQLRTKIGGKNKKERDNERQVAWKEKALHGQFLRETEGMQDQRRWQWLKAGELTRETERLICAAQEQALRTHAIKNGVDYQDMFTLCRLCKEKVESVTCIVSSCSVVAGNQYRKRHNKLGKKYTGSCARNLRLNVKTNDSHINQIQCWKMTNIKYVGTLQSKQIRK